MIKGLYAAASAMLAGTTQQSLLAHNVSNMDTPGFKQVLTSLENFWRTSEVQPPAEMAGQEGMARVGTLGLGVETAAQITDFSDGGLQYTGQPLDMSIQGPGFFRVETPAGERYTRDGRFTLDAEGNLVTVDGYKVLDDSAQPIQITEQGEVTVSGDGTLFLNGQELSKLGLASFNDPLNELQRDLPNTYMAITGEITGEQLGVVQQNYLEASNVNAASIMTQMVQVTRHYEAAQKLVQNQDDLLGRAIASLGKL